MTDGRHNWADALLPSKLMKAVITMRGCVAEQFRGSALPLVMPGGKHSPDLPARAVNMMVWSKCDRATVMHQKTKSVRFSTCVCMGGGGEGGVHAASLWQRLPRHDCCM